MSDQSFKRETVTGAFSSLARLSSASEGRCRLNIVVPSLMPTIDPWEARSRTYRSAFRSTSPQRGGLLNSPDSPTFQRSEAMVLGPGSYDIKPGFGAPVWIRNPLKMNSSFSSKLEQRASSKKLSTVDLDYSQANDAGQLSSVAATMGRQRWSHAPLKPAFFDYKPALAAAAANTPFYGMENKTMSTSQSHRRYAAVFHSKVPAPWSIVGGESALGPGSYEVIPDVNCGGIRHEERPGPSRMFVPRVGGKFAMVGGGF